MNYKDYFQNKKITLMGLGLLGRGLGDAKFLAENGALLTVTDLKNEKELQTSLESLHKYPNISYRLGGHELSDFQDCDYVLKAAGVPLDSPYIQEAKKNGIPVKMSTSWFAELSGIPILGVTGTRGKSTVTHLLYEILKEAAMDALLGGNVRGVSTLALLPRVTKDSVGVFELDSWQCQGFGDAKMSPHVAVFTTLFPDHMNYYADIDQYLEDKAQIFLHQKAGDTLVLGSAVAPVITEKFENAIHAKVVIADPAQFPEGWHMQLSGAHNLLNAMCAIQAARAFGVKDSAIKSVLASFEGVEGRLQFIREVNGVKIYNDTTATTPEATVAALHTLPGMRVILIMGGADKGLNITELLSLIPAYAKKVILLSGTGTERMRELSPELRAAPVYDTLRKAVEDAVESAEAGDTILFSPAFASFGMFKNEFDRGDQFSEIIRAL